MNGGTGFDVNSRSARWSAILFGVVGVQTFIIQPGFVQGLIERLHFTERQAGLVASAEVAGIALTSLALAFLSPRLDWRATIRAGAVLAAIANLASAAVTDFGPFAASRFVAGVGLGALVSLSWAAVGLTEDPEREFALYVGGALTYGAIGLLALPWALNTVGVSGVMVALAAVTLASATAVRFMPGSAESRATLNPDAIDIGGPMKAVALGGVFLFNLALGASWAYLFVIGVGAGLAEQSVANALALSQVAAVAGAVVPFALAGRVGRLAPIAIGLVASAGCVAVLTGRTSLLTFAICVGTFNFLWNVILPYLFASMASFDLSGRMVVYAVAVQMLGLGVGPAAGAAVITPGGFDAVLLLSAGAIGASLLATVAALLHHRSRWRAGSART